MTRCAGKTIVVLTDADSIPLSLGTVIVNGRELIAVVKRALANGGYAAADSNGSELRAIEERAIADILNAVADNNARKLCAEVECLFTDRGNAVGNYNANDSVVVLERAICDSGNSLTVIFGRNNKRSVGANTYSGNGVGAVIVNREGKTGGDVIAASIQTDTGGLVIVMAGDGKLFVGGVVTLATLLIFLPTNLGAGNLALVDNEVVAVCRNYDIGSTKLDFAGTAVRNNVIAAIFLTGCGNKVLLAGCRNMSVCGNHNFMEVGLAAMITYAVIVEAHFGTSSILTFVIGVLVADCGNSDNLNLALMVARLN